MTDNMNKYIRYDYFSPGLKLNEIVEANCRQDIGIDYVAMPTYKISHNSSYYDSIKQSLTFGSDPVNARDILDRMKNYINQKHWQLWTFGALTLFCDDNKNQGYFNKTIRQILNLVFKIERMPCIPFLSKSQTSPNVLTLGQEQIGILLANAFFCTFPMRHAGRSENKNQSMVLPTINFSSLFEDTTRLEVQMQKLKCIFHYFNRISEKGFFEENGCVTYSHHLLRDQINWAECSLPLSSLTVNDKEKIENQQGHLQVDFANKKVGGGVLGRGCLQEEIRFLICPELIAARLFTQQLSDTEVLVVTGCERFSDYHGYANTFQFTGDFKDRTERDSCGRRMTQVVMMDALKFNFPGDQYKLVNIHRELNKAYCGFKDYRNNPKSKPPPVATGNWGCGDFGGNKQFKFLIQLCSASTARRDVKYLTYEDASLARKIQLAYNILTRHCFTVADVYLLLTNHERYLQSKTERLDILDYVIKTFGDDHTASGDV